MMPFLAVAACGGPVGLAPPNAAPAASTGMNAGGAADTTAGGTLDVRLEAVAEARPGRVTHGRNPFRFGVSAPPAESALGSEDSLMPPPAGVDTGLVPAVPMLPRFPLRFIGVVETPTAGLIAVLTDGEVVLQGRQGDTVEGRYRIIRVGGDQVEIETLPGGDRQVLGLDGL